MPGQPRYKPGYNNSDNFWEWLQGNWKYVHNIAEFIGDTAYTGWNAAYNAVEVPKDDKFWYFIQKAQEAAAVFTGGTLPEGDLEEQFPQSTRRCTCAKQGGQLIAEVGTDSLDEQLFGSSWEAKEILDIYGEGEASFCKYKKIDGSTATEFIAKEGDLPLAVTWYIRPQAGTVCCGEVLDPPPKPPAPPPVTLEPNDEPEGKCHNTNEFILLDTYIDRHGMAWNKYLVKRNCFQDWCYWETPDGPYRSTAQRDNHRATDCREFDYPYPVIPTGDGFTDDGLSAVQYRIDAGCSWNPETEEYEQQYFYDVEEQPDSFLGLARRMDALAWMINTSGLIPYRVCNAKPKLEGDWVTTQWISEEPSSDSTLRLRKRIRFRSKQSRQYSDLLAHFRDFTWEAGPVCVIHKGAWWGTPQVWARDADEGKRVIRHVAGAAGIDPDQVGQWEISGSRNPRFGRRGKMRLRELEGMPWITARDGSNMLPMGDVEP